MEMLENGLYNIGTIEFEEPIEGDSVKAMSPELKAAQLVFCASWPITMVYLQFKIETIKRPVWKIFANMGLSIINGIHDMICKPSEGK